MQVFTLDASMLGLAFERTELVQFLFVWSFSLVI